MCGVRFCTDLTIEICHERRIQCDLGFSAVIETIPICLVMHPDFDRRDHLRSVSAGPGLLLDELLGLVAGCF